MPIRTPQHYLDQLYLVRDDLLSGKIQSYSIGDRNISLFNLADLDSIIKKVESAVVSNQLVIADLSGAANYPLSRGLHERDI